mmetsp:Transcript_26465/g.55460  ORF Transcript_26465/g.55460 Transcript_26465/m.55460 type:complete len:119 (+) Transcript_26465:1419-1775(+)
MQHPVAFGKEECCFPVETLDAFHEEAEGHGKGDAQGGRAWDDRVGPSSVGASPLEAVAFHVPYPSSGEAAACASEVASWGDSSSWDGEVEACPDRQGVLPMEEAWDSPSVAVEVETLG